MGIVTRRPDTTAPSSKGNWALTPSSGATVAQILSDDSDLTFLSTTSRSQLPGDFATFDIANLTSSDIPDDCAIKAVTLRAKVLQVAPSGGSSFLTDIIRFTGEIVETVITDPLQGLGDFLSEFFRHLFSFPCPTPPGGASATWQTVTIKTYTGSPAGSNWTRDLVNSQTWRIGRSDLSAQLSKLSEFYIDVEFNHAPVLTILGPTETRVFADGVTATNTTLTSATAAFTSKDVGATVTGAGIPANTTILTVNSATNVTLSAATTASASGVSVTLTRAVITTTTRPIFTISYTDTESDPQAAVAFRVFTAAQAAAPSFNVDTTPPYAASPGDLNWILGTSNQWLCNRDLPNGDYVVYSRAKQQWDGPELLSQWDAYNFTIAVQGPPVPILTATPNPALNSVQLDLIPTATPGAPAVETYNIYSSDDSGNSWQLIWGGWQVPASAIDGSAVRVDYLAPLNQNRWYKALAYATVGLIKVASDESNIAKAVPTYHEFAIKDPYAPSLNQPIGWMDDDPSEEGAQGIHIPLVANGDKAYPIVVDGPLQGITGDSKLLFIDPDDESWKKWKAIRAQRHTLLLQYPNGEQYWVRLKGEAKWSWHTDGDTGVDFRILSWGYIEVKPPRDPSVPLAAVTQ